MNKKGRTQRFLSGFFFVCALLVCCSFVHDAAASVATTSITISICGNSTVEGVEICDQGAANSNAYKTSIQERVCNTECSGWGPHCGDHVLNASYGEECDDGDNTAKDGCSPLCIIESTTGGGGGGAGPFIGGSPSSPNPTKIVVKGKAYPDADVHILKDGGVIGVVRADTNADFTFSTADITPGTATFGFWAEDKDKVKSVAFTVTLQVTASATTTISGVFLPPTISLQKRSVKKGEQLSAFGNTAPKVDVNVLVHSSEEVSGTTTSKDNGSWTMNIDTAALAEEEFHTAKAQFQMKESSGTILKSGFSSTASFYLGEKVAGKNAVAHDINGDGRINLVDFSILLYHWGTNNQSADLNSDGKVNLTDLSILLFYWTG